MGAILTCGLLVSQLGHAPGAERIESAVVAALEAGVTTPDLGGTRGTNEVGSWIAARLRGS